MQLTQKTAPTIVGAVFCYKQKGREINPTPKVKNL
jgi:hypothetical protein